MHMARRGRGRIGTTLPGKMGARGSGEDPQATGKCHNGKEAGTTDLGRRRPPALNWQYMNPSSIPGRVYSPKMHNKAHEVPRIALHFRLARLLAPLASPH